VIILNALVCNFCTLAANVFPISNSTLEHNNRNKVELWIGTVIIKVLNSTVSRSRLRIARPEVTFFEMCSTRAVQFRDSIVYH
jgi:hypothetical protein